MNEEEVREQLSDWFESIEGWSVWWGENGTESHSNFQMEGTSDRPDMLVSGDSTLLLELKDGDDSASIYDAMAQCHRYWSQVEFDDVKVYADGETREIDTVVIATQYSPHGHLFKREREQDYRQTYDDREAGWNKDMRPQYEFARTEAIPRIMWRYAWQEAEFRQNLTRENIEVGIGVLLSDEVDEPPEQTGLSQFGGVSNDPVPKVLLYDGTKKAHWGSAADLPEK